MARRRQGHVLDGQREVKEPFPRPTGAVDRAHAEDAPTGAEPGGLTVPFDRMAAMEAELLDELDARELLQATEHLEWDAWQEGLRWSRTLPPDDTRRLRRRFRWLPEEIGCPRGWRGLLETFCRTVRHRVPAGELWPRGPVRATAIVAWDGVWSLEFDGIAGAAPWAPALRACIAHHVDTASSHCETCGEDGEIRNVEGGPWVVCERCARARNGMPAGRRGHAWPRPGHRGRCRPEAPPAG